MSIDGKFNYNENYYEEVDRYFRDWRHSVWDDNLGDTPQENLSGQVAPVGWVEVLDSNGDPIVVIDGNGMTWLHAPTHEDGGSDPITLEQLGTLETDTSLRLAPDGSGGVSWEATVIPDPTTRWEPMMGTDGLVQLDSAGGPAMHEVTI